MFEKEIMISGLSKQRDTLKELVEELEEKPYLEPQDFRYCEEVLKRIEASLRKLRRPDRAYNQYVGSNVYA